MSLRTKECLPKSGSLQSGFSEPSDSVAMKICSMEAVLSGSGLCIISCSCSWKYRNLVLDHAATIQGFPGHEMQEERAGLEIVGLLYHTAGLNRLGPQAMVTPEEGLGCPVT